ncbi:MAG: sensor histidine kinase [Kiloniellaceae bacterium]
MVNSPCASKGLKARSPYARSPIVELLAFGVFLLALLAAARQFYAYEALHTYSRNHNRWELDEFIVTLCCFIITAIAFLVRRWSVEMRDKREIQELTADLARALEAATVADAAKSVFLANLSHELKTPSSAVNGYAHLIESGFMGPIDARYASYAKDIRESGEHLMELVNGVLDLTRLDSGKVTMRPQVVDLYELAQLCVRLVRPRAKEGDIVLMNRIPLDFPPVIADPQRLRQILINLIGNAVKFSHPGTQVYIAARAEPFATVVEISDEGIGMDPRDVERAVQPFVQIDSGLSRDHDGVGLGLALVKRFVELHDGSLVFDTAPGQGTRVTVPLPQPVPDARDAKEGRNLVWRMAESRLKAAGLNPAEVLGGASAVGWNRLQLDARVKRLANDR